MKISMVPLVIWLAVSQLALGAGGDWDWLSAEADSDTVVSIRAEEPIKVDGVLSEEAWQRADSANGFVRAESMRPAAEQTAVRVMHDEKTLYLGIVVGDMKIAAKARDRDKGTWEDDCVEIFLDPLRERRDRFHVIVSAAGSVFDAQLGDSAWLSELSVAVRRDEGRGWTVELAIPFASLEKKGVRRGEVWDLKLTREDYDRQGQTTPLLSSWRFAGKSFSDAGAFGRLVFESTNAAINGDVSDGLRDGRWCNGFWRLSPQSHGGSVELQESVGHDAGPSIRAVVDRYTQVQVCTPVSPMRNYRVSAWVSMDGASDRMRMTMYQEKNTTVAAKNQIQGWQKLETFVALGESPYLVLTFTIHGGEGYVLLDDLEVEETDNVPRGEDAVCYTGNAFESQARHNQRIAGRYTYCELGTRAAYFPQSEQRGAADVEPYAGWIDFDRGVLTDGKPTFSQFHNWTMDPGKTLLIDLGEDRFVTDIELEAVERRLRDVRVRFRPAGTERWTLVADHPAQGGTLQLTQLHAHTREIAIDYSGHPGLREVRIWGRPESGFVVPRPMAAPLSKDPAAGTGGSALAPSAFVIFPTPKHVKMGDGVMPLRDGMTISLAGDASNLARDVARRMADEMAFRAGVKDISVEQTAAADLVLKLGEVEGGEEGYRLTITPTEATIEANTPRGLAHGGHSLVQCIVSTSGGPALRTADVRDWPSYPLRAVQFWDRTLRNPAMQRAVEAVARMKLNELVLMGDNKPFAPGLAALGMHIVPRCADMPAGGWFRSVIEMNPGETIKDLDDLSRVNPCPSNPKTYELIAAEIERIRNYPGQYAYINCDEMYQEHKGARWNVCDLCTARHMTGGDLFAELITHIHTELKKVGKTPLMLDTMMYIPWKMEGGFAQLPKDIGVGIWHRLAQNGLEEMGFPVWEFLAGDRWTIDEKREHVLGAMVPGDGGMKLEKCAIWAEALWSGNYPDIDDPTTLGRLSDQMARVHEATIGAPLPSRAAGAGDFTPIDLQHAANVTLADKEAGDYEGLFDRGAGTDLSFMKGTHELSRGSFTIGEKIAVVENQGSLDRRVADRLTVAVNQPAASILFLHGLTQSLPWTYAAQHGYAGSYIIEYVDGTRIDHPILYKHNILELNALGANSRGYKSRLITVPAATPGYAAVMPSGNPFLLLTSEWVNPWPDREILSVTMQATSRKYGSRVALFAMTAVGAQDSVLPVGTPLPPATDRPDLSDLREIDLSAGLFESETTYLAPDGTKLEASSIYTLRGATLIQVMQVGYVTVDNNLGWQVVGEKPQTLTATFTSPRKLAGISILGLPESPEYVFENRLSGFDYTIEVSADGQTWEVVGERTKYLADREGESSHRLPAKMIQAVRVTVRQAAGPACMVRGLARLRLFESITE